MRPNFVFILADDLGYADLGCYGGRTPCSPVLDRLAAEGLRFTDGYSNSPVCSPTRFALMTGRFQYRLRGGNDEPIASRHRGQRGARPAAGASDAAVAAARRRLRHRARRQVAPRLPAALRPAEERLPGVLRPDERRRRLLHAPRLGGAARSLRGRARVARDGLPDRPHLRPRGGLHHAPARARRAVPALGPLHRAALALGDARGRGRGALDREDLPHRRRLGADLPHDDPADGRGHRPHPRRALRDRRRGQHAGRVHQRQRRRALLRHLAARRQEDGPAGGRHPRPLHRALARARPARPHDGAARDDDGLDRDVPRRRGRGAAPRLSARRDQPPAACSTTPAPPSTASSSGA